MPDAIRFVAAESGTVDLAAALDALAPQFVVEHSAARRIVRTWLDTHDWLLHQAGLVLEQDESASGDVELALRGPEGREHRQVLTVREQRPPGRRRAVPPAAIEWPALIGALPPGVLRERIEDVVGIRALLPVTRLRTHRSDLRVLNADRKTVVRIVIESPMATGGARLDDQLSVSAVRGYQDQADRVGARLATVPGIAADDLSIYERALRADGRSFGDDAPSQVDMSASMPASQAVIAVLQSFRSTVERTFEGVVCDTDTEFLHDFRVAVRRSRSTLKLTGDVLDAGSAEQLGRDLKWIADLTSATRDLDVYLLAMPGMATGLQSAERADLDPFHDYLRRRRRNEFRRLVRALRSARYRSALEHWRSLGPTPAEDAEQPMSVGELAAERLRQAHRRVTQRGRRIGEQSPPGDLHDLRKRCKELRYLLEIFRPLHDPSTHRVALKSLKALQEVLGDFQDGEVQGLAVREFAATMLSDGSAPAPTVLAMGELAAQLTAHQRRARAEFAQRFAAFDSARNRRRFTELAGASR